jgi:hypothetical protein
VRDANEFYDENVQIEKNIFIKNEKYIYFMIMSFLFPANKSYHPLSQIAIKDNVNSDYYLHKKSYANEQKESNCNEEFVWKNLCLECGEDMGDMNPRQLCGKYYCFNK